MCLVSLFMSEFPLFIGTSVRWGYILPSWSHLDLIMSLKVPSPNAVIIWDEGVNMGIEEGVGTTIRSLTDAKGNGKQKVKNITQFSLMKYKLFLSVLVLLLLNSVLASLLLKPCLFHTYSCPRENTNILILVLRTGSKPQAPYHISCLCSSQTTSCGVHF
jgi:hypothetical protein